MSQTQVESVRVQKFKQFVWTWVKRLYWIIGTLGLLFGCYYLYNVMERPISSVLIFLIGILALYYYWVKWFVIPESDATWPPYQTVCPDYLTLVDAGNGTEANPAKCMDFVGVSSNGGIQVSTPGNAEAMKANSSYTFTIAPKTSAQTISQYTQALCQQVQDKGLSWTGKCE
jgi:hypothetical protein